MAESIFRRLKSKFAGVIVQRKPGIQLEVLQYTGDANDCLDGTGAFSPKAGGGSGITQLTGDGTAGPGSGSQVFTLAATGVTPGSYGDATHVGQFTVDSKGRLTFAQAVAINFPSAPGRLIGIQTFTTVGSTTYTETAGTGFVIIYGQGPGGGSSGIASPGSGKVSIGRAGGAGGFFRKLLVANFSGAAIVIGGKGTGGASGDNAGNNGTAATTFTDTASNVYSAGVGSGGNNGGSGLTVFPNLSNQVLGGTATGGDINIDGIASELGIVQSATVARGGGGGWSQLGMGGSGSGVFTNNTSVAGGNGQGYGSGGGAPCATGTGVARAGADGADGYMEIWEFSLT